ncbi:uncharacterized protein EI97DRAFT_243447 [Westerdykella ornata]|uniref:Uncharacterized protein n=1 Tax=Westerdykella ornata TaxID=318751 RepID=A0A6A6J848_WESOR|nr:uncharacterized protein EI97DRAFT_243447 [Westerdykella ornata]KAF2271806.1 hypothetical protein EI97DRAFT_243447 [Westerdykella ornata]
MATFPLIKSQAPKLVLNLIDEKTQWLGDHAFMRYPSEDWESHGYRTITWRQYADSSTK